nr:RNA-directed DNA polymerase, eukaryota, reverse transcriptase zinc-binding domain protein [Tanacetum cinerariifolium]
MDGLAKISLPVYVANFPCHYRFGNYRAFVERFDRKAVRKNSHTGAKVVNPVDKGDRLRSSNKDTSYANVAKASINVGKGGSKVVVVDSGDHEPFINLQPCHTNDFSIAILGCYKDFCSIANARTLCRCEGFMEVVIKYLVNLLLTSFGFENYVVGHLFVEEDSCKDEEGSMGSFIQEQEEEGEIKENDAEIHAATHDDTGGDNVKFDEEHDMASNNSEEIPQCVKDSIVVPQLHELLDSDPLRLESLINKKYGSESINNPTSNNFYKPIGFSLVERLKETIKVRLALGLNIEGCENTLATLIANNGELNIMWILVYAPQNLSSKIALWSSLANLIDNLDEILVMMGDFNEVREAGERFGIKISKLVQLLVSKGFFDKFPYTSGLILEKERKITRDEIKRAVWDCGGDYALGPDGFTFKFFITFWDLLEEDVNRFVQDFFVSGSFLKGCNSLFIALIPKVSNATLVVDFHSISLIGCQYKIIGKILANRLSIVIRSCVSPEQSAFIKGRNILDVPLILSEVMAWYRKRKKQLIIFKVDFEKAFDSSLWDFLDLVIEKLDFGEWSRVNAHNLLCVCVFDENISNMAAILGCGAAALPLKYLGASSICGRLSLIKSVLKSLSTYYMSLYKVRVSVCNKLESMRNSFFIGGDLGEKKMSWVSWKKCMARKKLGDLDIGSIIEFNELHGHNGGIFDVPFFKSCNSPWCGTLPSVKTLKQKGTIELSEHNDSWKWSLDVSNGFFVTSTRSLIDSCTLDDDRKGIEVDSLLYPICHEDVEMANHTFFNCEMAQDLWDLLARWWELDIPFCDNISEWFTWLDSSSLSTKARLILDGVGGTLLWFIWSFHNRLVFSNSPPKKMVLWDRIVSQSFLWISSKNPRFNLVG